MPILNCRYFSGYKPCGKNASCDDSCPEKSLVSTRILIVHLEALGAVMRSTALLPAVKRKYPGCHITWVTQKPADQLLINNPYIDRVLTTTSDDLLQLSVLEFDFGFSVDKGLKSAGVMKLAHVDQVFGFGIDAPTGAVIPLSQAANELWEIGLSNQKKFFENRKPETQLAHEALELGKWIRDDYVLRLTVSEKIEASRRKNVWAPNGETVIGLNTGCSGVIAYKKLTIETQRELAKRFSEIPGIRVILLGGKEDEVRNQRIGFGLPAVQTPTDRGLRDGLVSVEACDAVVTGDSLGMHIAIALKKWTVAWFGPTCAHEIDLYDRGVSLLTTASCSPCWKRSCDRQVMCYDLVAVDRIVEAVMTGVRTREKSRNAISSENEELFDLK